MMFQRRGASFCGRTSLFLSLFLGFASPSFAAMPATGFVVLPVWSQDPAMLQQLTAAHSMVLLTEDESGVQHSLSLTPPTWLPSESAGAASLLAMPDMDAETQVLGLMETIAFDAADEPADLSQEVTGNPPEQQPSYDGPQNIYYIHGGGAVAQATEYAPRYGQFLDISSVAQTTVNATQNVNTFNIISIIQNCGDGCTQLANPVANAGSTVGMDITAGAWNDNTVSQQWNGSLNMFPSAGSGVLAVPSSSALQQLLNANTALGSAQSVLSSNGASVSQLGGNNGSQTASAALNAMSLPSSILDALSANTSLFLHTAP